MLAPAMQRLRSCALRIFAAVPPAALSIRPSPSWPPARISDPASSNPAFSRFVAPCTFPPSSRPPHPEFVGCSPSLSGAIRVNPWSIESVADGMYAALRTSKQER